MSNSTRFIFSGHETFQCRHLWLKKGYDFIRSGRAFNDSDAVIYLGVGKNMVNAIRFWMKAFEVADANDQLTEFGHLVFSDDGFDPYLEDDASLWLLHYRLVKANYASLYSIIFNEFRKEKIEFSKEQLLGYMNYTFEDIIDIKAKKNTIEQDFVVFTRMYGAESEGKDKDDIIGGVLSELQLVRNIGKQTFSIEPTNRESLPDEVLLYAILDSYVGQVSISFQTLLSDKNSPGTIFALTEAGLYHKLESLALSYPEMLVFKDDAGVKELQLKGNNLDPINVLKDYYAAVN